MGIGYSTLQTWKNEHRDIRDSLKKGKEVVDREVENALLQKALGFKGTVRKPIKCKEVLYDNGKRISEKEHIEYAEEEIYIPPDTTAAIFWLKNRKSEEWRDKRQVEEKVEFESDGFLEALKEGTAALFESSGDDIET